MNILVIGGAGYIGSHAVYELNDAGHQVTILDNFSTGLRENVDARAELVEGDVQDLTLLSRILAGNGGSDGSPFDSVFHFAALKAAGESMTDPEIYTSSNLVATMELLNMMVRHNVKNFVFSSSAATYGEPEYLPIDENHPQNPINYYGYTKLVIEQTLSWYSRLRGLRYAALRYFNAAGYDTQGRITGKEQNPANLLPIVMEAASGQRKSMQVFGNDYPTRDGTCIRDYIHVNDLATAHVRSMEYLKEKDEDLCLNLATGKGYTVLEVIKEAEKVSGRTVPYKITDRRPGDPAELVAASTRALETIGWKARHSDVSQIVESMWHIYK
ncbi:UDP-glucose 4-epimerase GalE [Natronogracilivirga saccharolytica]|uniref:UDP-glucose 4-epimerase n=1 Tax=Natronogracilivirga saccharolytica TaxID=2812953 RepID=A0A8J7RJM4_9BACT|nr:UDP-glucose 4-epimerase GalE [Natronogracilivirga saccharolytica]MBP3192955.1 UDP-glucose 4-epimerase GalE [Natronogracilivirga saccharolytica]